MGREKRSWEMDGSEFRTTSLSGMLSEMWEVVAMCGCAEGGNVKRYPRALGGILRGLRGLRSAKICCPGIGMMFMGSVIRLSWSARLRYSVLDERESRHDVYEEKTGQDNAA